MSRVIAGPLCSTLLGDLGASVIKVERRETGDETRGRGPPFDECGHSAYFLSVNRNKLSMVADLAKPCDTALLRSLIADAHVVIDNLRGDPLVRRGLDPEYSWPTTRSWSGARFPDSAWAAIVPDTASPSGRSPDGWQSPVSPEANR